VVLPELHAPLEGNDEVGHAIAVEVAEHGADSSGSVAKAAVRRGREDMAAVLARAVEEKHARAGAEEDVRPASAVHVAPGHAVPSEAGKSVGAGESISR